MMVLMMGYTLTGLWLLRFSLALPRYDKWLLRRRAPRR